MGFFNGELYRRPNVFSCFTPCGWRKQHLRSSHRLPKCHLTQQRLILLMFSPSLGLAAHHNVLAVPVLTHAVFASSPVLNRISEGLHLLFCTAAPLNRRTHWFNQNKTKEKKNENVLVPPAAKHNLSPCSLEHPCPSHYSCCGIPCSLLPVGEWEGNMIKMLFQGSQPWCAANKLSAMGHV